MSSIGSAAVAEWGIEKGARGLRGSIPNTQCPTFDPGGIA